MKATIDGYIICWAFSLGMLIAPRFGSAQEYDSAFWAQHSFHRPDSVLLKDSFWFPPEPVFERYLYSEREDLAKWAGPGARSYGNFGAWYSAVITLRADHSFVFDAGFEVGTNLTVGRWTEETDSIVTLEWDGMLSLHLCRDRKFDAKYFHRKRNKIFSPWPAKIEHWRFLRRGHDLVPLDSTRPLS